MENQKCSISGEKWQKSLLALSSQEAAGVGCGLRASCDPQLWISRGEEGIAPTLSQPLCHPVKLFQAAPLQWDICCPTHLSSESHREGITHPSLSFPTSAPVWSSIPKNPGELRPGCAVGKAEMNKPS